MNHQDNGGVVLLQHFDKAPLEFKILIKEIIETQKFSSNHKVYHVKKGIRFIATVGLGKSDAYFSSWLSLDFGDYCNDEIRELVRKRYQVAI